MAQIFFKGGGVKWILPPSAPLPNQLSYPIIYLKNLGKKFYKKIMHKKFYLGGGDKIPLAPPSPTSTYPTLILYTT